MSILRLNIALLLLILIVSGSSVFAQRGSETVPEEFIPEVNFDLAQDRLSCIEREVPLHFNSIVHSFIEYFVIRDRAYTRMVMQRKELYFPLFEEKLKKYGLPDELKYLSIIESGLNPVAISRAGAAGLWQFMPYTGSSFGLHQDWYIDERMDPEESTEAACKYLKQLYKMFGDWPLALASYNAGPGNVRKAIRRSGYKKTFWEVYDYLPRETRSYVPQLVAMIYTLNYADQHNLFVDQQQYLPEYDTISVSQYFHLETFTNQLDICFDDIVRLNPHVKRGALPDEIRNFPLRVPSDLKPYITANRNVLYDTASKVGKSHLEYLARNTPGSTYGRQRIVYRVRSGDVLGKIALQYNVRIADLKNWNRISGNIIRVGQRLNIWVLPNYSSQTKDLYASSEVVKPVPTVSNAVKKPAASTVASTSGKYYTVQNGDTLWDITKLYKDLTIERIKELNNLTGDKIKPGQKLLIGID